MSAEDLKRFTELKLVGRSVRLRPLRREDAAPAFSLLSDDHVTRTLQWDGPSSVETLADGYDAMGLPGAAEVSRGYHFAIEAVTKAGIIGSIAARPIVHPLQLDIGYWLGVPYWGRGLMTDAVRPVAHFSFQHLDAVRAYATVFVGNVGSDRVLEKCGFSLDRTLRCHAFKRGQWLDEWFFTLLRADWEAHKDEYLPGQEPVVRESEDRTQA